MVFHSSSKSKFKVELPTLTGYWPCPFSNCVFIHLNFVSVIAEIHKTELGQNQGILIKDAYILKGPQALCILLFNLTM